MRQYISRSTANNAVNKDFSRKTALQPHTNQSQKSSILKVGHTIVMELQFNSDFSAYDQSSAVIKIELVSLGYGVCWRNA